MESFPGVFERSKKDAEIIGEMAVFLVLLIFFWDVYIMCMNIGFRCLDAKHLSHNQSCAKDHQLGPLDFAS